MTNRCIVLFTTLFILWLLMSGIYNPLTIFMGFISCGLVVWIVRSLGLLDQHQPPIMMKGILSYVVWLIIEIAKANLIMTKVILSDQLPDNQRLIRVSSTQKSDLGKVLFANSITMTPGTITVETEPSFFFVHVITDDAIDQNTLIAMNNRVSQLVSNPT
ncbi:Na+/H+ antiporter subunit E [Candidatus Endowatersipora endosymbiont of Watersipora subatra]|uniref:Na+/H+ antiporter subunit E n=1 Tax=Candidatus Endowatersipora endosymbiont of Watersipora subatra TaxID=3077946 RepID=UPI00312C98A8